MNNNSPPQPVDFDEDDVDNTDWEHIYWVMREVPLYPEEKLPSYTSASMMSSGFPEDWTILYWALRMDTLEIASCTFSPVGGLPHGSGFGTYVRVTLAPEGSSGNIDDESTLTKIEAVIDNKMNEVRAVAPEWYWKKRWSLPSPIPEEVELYLREQY